MAYAQSWSWREWTYGDGNGDAQSWESSHTFSPTNTQMYSKWQNVDNNIVIEYRDSLLRRGDNVTFDEVRRHLESILGRTLRGGAEICKIDPLNLILRKEQALTQYLQSYRERHAIWSVLDMEAGFLNSKLCKEEWFVQRWDTLEVGPLSSHSAFVEIFPELGKPLRSANVQSSLTTASEILSDLMEYRFHRGLHTRVDLEEFKAWCCERAGVPIEARGVAINGRKLGLVIAGQNAVLHEQSRLKKDARVRYLQELGKRADADILNEVEEALSEAEASCVADSSSSSANTLWIDAERLLDNWRKVLSGTVGNKTGVKHEAYAGLSQWARYKLDTPLELGPLNYFLRVALAAIVTSLYNNPVASKAAYADEFRTIHSSVASCGLDKRHCSPNEIVEGIRQRLAETTDASVPFGVKHLADIEEATLAGAPSLESLIGPGGSCGFLRFIADDELLRVAIDRRLRSSSGSGACNTKSLPVCDLQLLPQMTCQALEQAALRRNGMPGVLVDGAALVEAERIVYERLGIVATAEWGGAMSFASYVVQCPLIKKQGWRLQLEECAPLAIFANQLRWIWGASVGLDIEHTVAAHVGGGIAGSTLIPPRELTHMNGVMTPNSGKGGVTDLQNLAGLEFEAVALARLQQNQRADSCFANVDEDENCIEDVTNLEAEERFGVTEWSFEFYQDARGRFLERDRDIALNAINAVPYLADVAQATCWKHGFASRIGSLAQFITSISEIGLLEKRDLRFLVVAPLCSEEMKAEPTIFRIPSCSIGANTNSSLGQRLEQALVLGDFRTAAAFVVALCVDSPRGGTAEVVASYLRKWSTAVGSDSKRSSHVAKDTVASVMNLMWYLPEGIRQSTFGRKSFLPALETEVGWEDRAIATARKSPEYLKMLTGLGRMWGISQWHPGVLTETSISSVEPSVITPVVEQDYSPEGKPDIENEFTVSANEGSASDNETCCVDDRSSLAEGLVSSAMSLEGCKAVEHETREDPSPTTSPRPGQRASEHTSDGCDIDANCEEERELEKIREGFLLDNAAAKQLQENLGGSLERLSKDLSREQHRFVHELLQNADDCDFSNGVVPTVELILKEDEFVIRSNEVGFTCANVHALCSVDRSTKVHSALSGRELIGRKGIGFKAVFKVSDKPEVHSGRWHFRFDATLEIPGVNLKGLGYIIPHNLQVPASAVEEGRWWRTELRLPFKTCLGEAELAHLRNDLNALDGVILLNLQVIQELRISERISQQDVFSTRRMWKQELLAEGRSPPRVVRIFEEKNQVTSFQDYLVSEKRFGGTMQIKASLPLPSHTIASSASWRRKEFLPQPTFCFLPLRAFGWRFVLHANFNVTASRDEIHEANSHNQEILQKIPHVLVDLLFEAKKLSMQPLPWTSYYASDEQQDPLSSAVASFKCEPPVRCLPWNFVLWFMPVPASHGLPGHLGANQGDFFRGLEPTIWKQLKTVKCLFDLDGDLVEPNQTFAVPPNLENQFFDIFPSPMLWRLLQLRYLHPACAQALPPRAEEFLGIRGTLAAFRIVLELLGKLKSLVTNAAPESSEDACVLADMTWLQRALTLASKLAFGGGDARIVEATDRSSLCRNHGASFGDESRRRFEELAKLRILPVQSDGPLEFAAAADGDLFFVPSATRKGALLQRLVSGLGMRLVHTSLLESHSDATSGQPACETNVLQRFLQQLRVEELTPARLISCGALPFLCGLRSSRSKANDAKVVRIVADCIVYIARFAEESSSSCEVLLRTHIAADSVRSAWTALKDEHELTLTGAIRNLSVLPCDNLLRSDEDTSVADLKNEVLIGPNRPGTIISLPPAYHGALAKEKKKNIGALAEDIIAHKILEAADFREMFNNGSAFQSMKANSTCSRAVDSEELRAYVLHGLGEAAKEAYKEVKLRIESLVTFLCQNFGVHIVLLHAMRQSCIVDELKASEFITSRVAAPAQTLTSSTIIGARLDDYTCLALQHLFTTRFGMATWPRCANVSSPLAVQLVKVLSACFHLDRWSQKQYATLHFPVPAAAGMRVISDEIEKVPSSLNILLRSAPWVPVRTGDQRPVQCPVDFPIFFQSDLLAQSPLLEQEFSIVDLSWYTDDEGLLVRRMLETLGVREVRASDAIELLRNLSTSNTEYISERFLTQAYTFIYDQEQHAGTTFMYSALSSHESLIFVPHERESTKMSERAMHRGENNNLMRGYWARGDDCCIMILRDPRIKDSSGGKISVELSKKGAIRELELHYHACLCKPFLAFGISRRAEAAQLIRSVESFATRSDTPIEHAVEWAFWVYRWCTDTNHISQDGYSDLRVLLSRHQVLLVERVLPTLHQEAVSNEKKWVAWRLLDREAIDDIHCDAEDNAVDIFLPGHSANLPLHLALSSRFSALFEFFENRLGMRRASLTSLHPESNYIGELRGIAVSVPLVDEAFAIQCEKEDWLLRKAAAYLQIWLNAKYDFIRSYLDARRSQLQALEIRMGIGHGMGVLVDGAPRAAYHSDANVLSIWKSAGDAGDATDATIFEACLRSAAHVLTCEVLGLGIVFGHEVSKCVGSQAEALLIKCIERLQEGASESPGRAAMLVLREYGLSKWLECAEEATQLPADSWWFRVPPLQMEPGKDWGNAQKVDKEKLQLMPVAGTLRGEGGGREGRGRGLGEEEQEEKGEALLVSSDRAKVTDSFARYPPASLLEAPYSSRGLQRNHILCETSESDCGVTSRDPHRWQMHQRSHSVPHSSSRPCASMSSDWPVSMIEHSAERCRWKQSSLSDRTAEHYVAHCESRRPSKDEYNASVGILSQPERSQTNAARVHMLRTSENSHREQQYRQHKPDARMGVVGGFVAHMQQQAEKAHRRHRSSAPVSQGGRHRSRSRSGGDELGEFVIPDVSMLFEDAEAVEDMPDELFSFPEESTEEQRAVGRWGEEWAFNYLRRFLGEEWSVVWHNDEKETGEWFDIRADPCVSIPGDAETQYFEVKSTSSDQKHFFDVSAQQILKADKLRERFTFLRVCGAGTKHAKMRLYQDPGLLWKQKEKTGVSLKVHLDDPS